MNSAFYKRTQYRFLHNLLPPCFIEIDEFICSRYATMVEINASHDLSLVENVCKRIADIDFYAGKIEEVLNEKDPFTASISSASYIVAFLSSCKSFLDSCSITLSDIYSFGLSKKEQDFSKPKFWRVFEATEPKRYSVYSKYRSLTKEIIDWRDSAVHRITPIVLVHFPSDNTNVSRDDMKIKMISSPDIDFPYLISRFKHVEWISPLRLHEDWRSQLVAVCDEICFDIRKTMTDGI